jgi:hypothetical protein
VGVKSPFATAATMAAEALHRRNRSGNSIVGTARGTSNKERAALG